MFLTLFIFGMSFGQPSLKFFACNVQNLCRVELSKVVPAEEELWFTRVDGSKIMYRIPAGFRYFEYREVPNLAVQSVTFRGKTKKAK